MTSAAASIASPLAKLAADPVIAQPSQPHLRAQPAMTGQVLVEFFKDVDSQGRARLSVLMDTLAPLSREERDSAIKSYKDANKIPSAKKDGKTVIDPVASTRASEVKALWAALALANADAGELSSMGYHKAVAQARVILNEKQIDPDGDRVLSAEERTAKRKAKVQEQIQDQAMERAMEANPQKAGESLAQYLTRIAAVADAEQAKVSDEVISDRARSLFDSLTKREQPAVLAALAALILKSQGE